MPMSIIERTIQVSFRHRVFFTRCVFDPGNPVLRYGDRINRGRFRCKSKQSGVECVNRRNGHGFKISKQRAQLF